MMDADTIKLIADSVAAEHTFDGSTVGVEAVPTDESLLCNKLKEERDWRPYCMKCDTFSRMSRREYGFQCAKCKNKINWDMSHYEEPKETSVQPSNKLKRPLTLSAAMASAAALSARCPGTIDDIRRIGGLPRSAPPRKQYYTVDSPEVKAMSSKK